MPDGAPLLLGIDVGTSRTKALLLDRDGVEVAVAVTHTPFAAEPAGVEAGVDDLLAAVAAVLADLGDGLRRVTAVGIAGLAESGAPLDRDGRPLAPVIAWHDPRGAETVALLEARFGDDLPLRIGQRLRPVSSVAKIGWLMANGVEGVRWWLGVPELCLQGLTGARATDFSLAARTGAYDVGRRAPIPEVLDALGLPPDAFPRPVAAGAVMGMVSAAGAAWSGLCAGIPVTIAGHDHLAGVVGSGAGTGDLVNSVGTAETVLARSALLPDIRSALDRRTAVTLWPEGNGWVVQASAARSGLVLDAAARLLGGSPAELDALAEEADGVDVAAWVEATAQAVRSSDADPPASPGGSSDGSPDGVCGDGGAGLAESGTAAGPSPVGAARQPVGGALPAGSPGAVWNGVLAALAARTWDAAGRVEAVCGPAGRLVVVGGGSRSRPWLRAKAARGHLPVVRSGAGEAVARGAAVSAGVAGGWWPSLSEAPAVDLEPVPAPDSGER